MVKAAKPAEKNFFKNFQKVCHKTSVQDIYIMGGKNSDGGKRGAWWWEVTNCEMILAGAGFFAMLVCGIIGDLLSLAEDTGKK